MFKAERQLTRLTPGELIAPRVRSAKSIDEFGFKDVSELTRPAGEVIVSSQM